MENIFNTFALAFADSNLYGMLTVSIALFVLGLGLCLLFHIGVKWWCIIDDSKTVDILSEMFKGNWARDIDFNNTNTSTFKSDYFTSKIVTVADLEQGCLEAIAYYNPDDVVLKPVSISSLYLAAIISLIILGVGLTLTGITIDLLTFAPVVTSIVLTLGLSTFIARSVRRLIKKVDAHTADTNAHSKGESND